MHIKCFPKRELKNGKTIVSVNTVSPSQAIIPTKMIGMLCGEYVIEIMEWKSGNGDFLRVKLLSTWISVPYRDIVKPDFFDAEGL